MCGGWLSVCVSVCVCACVRACVCVRVLPLPPTDYKFQQRLDNMAIITHGDPLLTQRKWVLVDLVLCQTLHNYTPLAPFSPLLVFPWLVRMGIQRSVPVTAV